MRAPTHSAPTVPRPPAVRGFEQLHRFWDPASGRWTARLLPGQYYVTRCNEAMQTILGSCVSACLRDPLLNIGGMNHFMLPEETSHGSNLWLDPKLGLATRYGSYAMESLINQLLKLGAVRQRLELKIFGGSHLLQTVTGVGKRNIDFMLEYARVEGLNLAAQDLGGSQPRKIVYTPADGKVSVHRMKHRTHDIVDRERDYLNSLPHQDSNDAMDLFQ